MTKLAMHGLYIYNEWKELKSTTREIVKVKLGI